METNTINSPMDEVRELMRQLFHKFNNENDFRAIANVRQGGVLIEKKRDEVRDQYIKKLQSWEKEIQKMEWEAKRPSGRSEEEHVLKIERLDKIKFALGREITDLENTVNGMDKETKELNISSFNLEEKIIILKQKDDEVEKYQMLFRSLGVIYSGKTEGSKIKFMLADPKNNDIREFIISEEKDEEPDANYLWDIIT
eukprot:GHVP01021713.1.p1 GENE.GHVP01021713.1~~GHVP01021713.1.p1  ORF type:complete len:198 (-),score=45.45 GHVP01021713.1:71-664(-)